MSAYFGRRSGQVKHTFPKLATVCDTRSYLNLSAQASIGPWPDCPSFESLLTRALERVEITVMLADAGYDSEPNHEYADVLGVRSIMPPTIGRPPKTGPTGRHRNKLWRRFPKKKYGQRWHVEGTYSQDKRRFGSQLRSTSVAGQWGELLLRVLVHNTALLLHRQFQAPPNPPKTYAFNRAGGSPNPVLSNCCRSRLTSRAGFYQLLRASACGSLAKQDVRHFYGSSLHGSTGRATTRRAQRACSTLWRLRLFANDGSAGTTLLGTSRSHLSLTWRLPGTAAVPTGILLRCRRLSTRRWGVAREISTDGAAS
ncbi:MAG: transposase [Planctomycetes bacterium]|nr:transposase [Planctomycetota bacterium]